MSKCLIAREPGQARKRAARLGMLDALGIAELRRSNGLFIDDDERPPKTCPLFYSRG